METPDLTHPAWISGFGTIVGYVLISVLITITIFLVPYLIFLAL